ncbi:hypothetical protein M9Y10_038955 [Tritrichomonas musculus]|uniref:Beige/BEACH domain containing protein n=1 Tax=Tritrichomonas musculus TaxID=1915356 RepID=A0ABR2KAG7_9EUKA
MKLSRYIEIIHDTCPQFTDSEVDDILEIFSIPVSQSSEFFQFDSAMIKQFLLLRSTKERHLALSVILDFPSLLDIDYEKADLGTSLRQLIAIGYYMPQLIRSNHYQFLHAMLSTFKKMISDLQKNHHFFRQYTTSLSFVLSKLTKRMLDVDISNSIYKPYQDIIDLSLQLYKNKEMITKREMPKILPFFFNCLFVFRGKEDLTPDQTRILIDLLSFLRRYIKSSGDCGFNYLTFMNHAFSLLINYSSLSLKCKNKLLYFIIGLTSMSRDVSVFIFKEENSTFIVHYIISSLQMIHFDFPDSKILPPKDNTPLLTHQYDIIHNKIKRTFSEDIKIYNEEERKTFRDKTPIIPKSPACVQENTDLCELIQSIIQLCNYKSASVKATFNSDFMKFILIDVPLTSLPIFPFFLASWLCQFLEFDIDPISEYLHKMNFYSILLNCAFLKYNDKSLRDFIINLIVSLSERFHLRKPYFLSDLMIFTFQQIDKLDVDQHLIDGLAMSASRSSSVFVNASLEIGFADKLADSLGELMYRHSNEAQENREKIASTRMKLLSFVDRIDTFPLIFQYLFENKKFSDIILAHFYDPSTINFASQQILFVFQQFSRRSQTMTKIIKFFESFEVDEKLIKILLNCSSSGYETNQFEIAKLFTETNFLEFLIDSSRKLNTDQFFYDLLDLFSKITKSGDYTVNFDIFLRLSNLIPENFDLLLLWKIVFEDEKGDTEPRSIKNPFPISLIFTQKVKRGESREFVQFLSKCIDIDPDVKYYLSTLDFPSLLLKTLSEYRAKEGSDELFDDFFNLFYSLSLYNLKSRDFRSLFRFCASLPDQKRPFFTLRVINMISDLFKKRCQSPTSFFKLSGNDTRLQLPEIPIELINNTGFLFSFEIYFDTDDFDGKIFEFSSFSNRMALEWKRDHFEFSYKIGEVTNKAETKDKLKTKVWMTMEIFYAPTQMIVIQNRNSQKSQDHQSIEFSFKYHEIKYPSGFTHFRAFVNIPCKVCRVFCSKEVIHQDLIRCYNLLPRSKPTSFHESEKSQFFSFFNPIFNSSFAQKVLFVFYASVVFDKFAVNLVYPTTLRVVGSILNNEPEPIFLLDLLGGISTFLPFFGQLDHQLVTGQSFDQHFLPSLLNLLTAVFSSDFTNGAQKMFKKINGPSILAFLLSISSLKNLQNDKVIDSICELFVSLRFVPLINNFVDNVMFNFKLWLYLPIEFQTRAYLRFYEIIYKQLLNRESSKQSKLREFNISKLLMLMRVYLWTHNSNKKICLVDEPKMDILNKNVEAERPSDCTKIRDCFWEIIKQMTDEFLTEDDVSLLISFCCETLDLEFSQESMKLFIFLLQRKNKVVMQYMTKDYAFSSLYNLFKLPNPISLKSVYHIFLLLNNEHLKPFKRNQWESGIISTITFSTIDEEFVEITKRAMIKRSKQIVTYAHLIPLFLLGIQQLPEEKSVPHFDYLTNIILNSNNDSLEDSWDYPFVLLLMAQLPSAQSQVNKLSEHCIEFLTSMYIKSSCQSPSSEQEAQSQTDNLNQLSKSGSKYLALTAFVHSMSYRSKHNYTHIIRLLFAHFLQTEDVRIKSNSSLDSEAFIQIYSQIIQFILVLPLVNVSNQETNINYQELFKVSLDQKKHSPKFVLGPRYTNSEDGQPVEWVDSNLAKLIIRSILDRSAIFQKKKFRDINFIYLMGHLIHLGLKVPSLLNDFMNLSDNFIQFVHKNSENLHPYRQAIVEVFAGLVKANEINKTATTNFIYTNTILCADILQQQFKITVPATTSNDFDTNFLNPLIEKSNEYETNLQKTLKIFISKKESQIASILHDSPGIVELNKILKKGEMTEEVSLRTSLEHFALSRREEETSAIKGYKNIFRRLSSENGPWQTVEAEKEKHRKLANKIHHFCLFFMKTNFNFDDHKQASLTRDLGSVQNAEEVYQREFAKLKMTTFKGDLALIAADRQKLHNFNKLTEKVILKLDCSLVTMKKNYSGTLLMTINAIIFESSERFNRIPLKSISSVYQRHYLLLDTAVEIFTTYKKAYFCDFSSNEQRHLFLQMLNEFRTPNIRFIQLNYEDIKPLINRSIKRWQKGELSNFDYLLKINKYAGRSYNDLSQYPVFPWVLQDYRSETLDLNDPKVYRDLSKPLGTFSKDRLENLKERIVGIKRFDPDSYYLYGALYSSAAVVIGYMIRMEPFTSLHIILQSQRFDVADRLFNDIARSWDSTTGSSMDFRELIPEFFYLPDFLINENNFDLGCETNSEVPVGDVVLPKWASSPLDFITKNRMALESPFVTLNLHKWIDLIFGPKSRGDLAILNDNIYHPYFFENALEGREGKMYNVIREFAACFGEAATQIFDVEPPQKINEPKAFPAAFFSIKHTITNALPKTVKCISSSVLYLPTQTIETNSSHDNAQNNILSDHHSLPTSTNQVNLSISKHRFIASLDSAFNFALFYPDQHANIRRGKLILNIPSELEDVCEMGQKVAICRNAAVVSLPWDPALFFFDLDFINKKYIKSGHSSKGILKNKNKSHSSSSNGLKDIIQIKPSVISRLHNVTITAIAMDEKYIATGSKDSTVRLWMHHCESKSYLPIKSQDPNEIQPDNNNDNTKGNTSENSNSNAPISIFKELLKPIDVIAKHQSAVAAIAINSRLNTCFSISTDGYLMSTSLITGTFINGTHVQVIGDPISISTSDMGDVAVSMNGSIMESKIATFDQNLKPISEKALNSLIYSTTVIPWTDGINYLVVSMRDHITKILKLPFLEDTELSIQEINHDTTVVDFDRMGNALLIGDADGMIHSYKFDELE